MEGINKSFFIKSSVMIKFIEKKGGECFYRSGCSITVYGNVKKEYADFNALRI